MEAVKKEGRKIVRAGKDRKAGTCREGWNQWHSDAERGRVERQGDREKKVEMCRGGGEGSIYFCEFLSPHQPMCGDHHQDLTQESGHMTNIHHNSNLIPRLTLPPRHT